MIRAVVYFGLVFGVGFLLGTVRVLALVPNIGERWAELAEAPCMLVATYYAARFVVRKFPAPDAAQYLVSGAAALVLLVLVEFSVVLGIRGLSIGEYFAQRDPVAGTVYVLLLAVFAAMPWLVGRRPTPRSPSRSSSA